MNKLIKKERYFLLFLLTASERQRKVLIEHIDDSQLKALVQIVYNVMFGYRSITSVEKSKLSKRKHIFRKFVNKGISNKQRKKVLKRYLKFILPFIEVVKKDIL